MNLSWLDKSTQTYRICLLTGAITLLPEAAATPHTDSGESTLDALPQVLRDRVDPQLRPISDGRRKRKRRDAQNYISEQIWQPQFRQMFPGSVAVWLAPDADSESAYAFRISVGRGTKSGWLNMGVVDSIDRDTQTITWAYLCPRKFTGSSSDKYLAKTVAGNQKSWLLGDKVDSPWNDDEMLLSWDRDENERGWSIKAEQYDQLATVILAIETAGDEESEYDVEEDCDNT